MFNRREAEDLILAMADIVREVRYLRQENNELSEEVYELRQREAKRYEQSQRQAGEALKLALDFCISHDERVKNAQETLEEISKDLTNKKFL